MAIITNIENTVECSVKQVNFEDGVCKVSRLKIDHIISECGDVDLESLVAFNPEEMSHENDMSKPIKVVFVD